MFAIIKIQGKQYLVSKGDVLETDKIENIKKDQIINFDEVLLYADEKKHKIGQPHVQGAKVKARVLEPFKKGKKIEILKFKPKKRYLKKRGFRPQFTVLKIQDIVCQ